MSGIPHIYDALNFFDIYEVDCEEYATEQIKDIEYEDLIEKIEEHLFEEEIMLRRIRLLEESK